MPTKNKLFQSRKKKRSQTIWETVTDESIENQQVATYVPTLTESSIISVKHELV